MFLISSLEVLLCGGKSTMSFIFLFFFLTFSILFCISVFVLPGIYPYIYVKTFLYFKFLGSFLLGPLEKERGYPVFILRKQDLQLSLRYCFVVVIFFF